MTNDTKRQEPAIAASKSNQKPLQLPQIEPLIDAPENAIFQAIGIIVGEVSFDDEKATISIGGKKYPLFYVPRYKKGFEALKLNIKATGSTQRLLVYPRITHFPGGKPHQIAFQVVGFEGKTGDLQHAGLEDFEFSLCGLWQFIPVSKTPCITVLKNFTEKRLAYLKEAPSASRVKFMKASHIPVFWKDSPVKPFRFNPKLEKEQQAQTWFVGIKAKFLPSRDVFEFTSLKIPPSAKVPKYLKANKEEKLQVRREQSQSRHSNKTA